MESDWKAFRKMLPEVRERYLGNRNAELARMLEDPNQTPTERFWNTHEKINEESKILQRCLDRASRSRMDEMICRMLDCGILTNDDLSVFSEVLQGEIRRWRGE